MSRYADTDSELNEDGEGYFFDDPDFKEALAELEVRFHATYSSTQGLTSSHQLHSASGSKKLLYSTII